MNAQNNWSLFYHKKKKNTYQILLDIDEFSWNYVFVSLNIEFRSHYEMFHFTKIENSIIPTSGEIISIRNCESDRSIDHFCGDDEMNWNEEKSREENREKKKRKKKRSIKLFLHDRSLEKSSLPARCLSLSP